MKENFNHKIQRLELENFTCFSKIKMDFSSGINLFIGENGTGKTHVLNMLYAMMRKNPDFEVVKKQMELQGKAGAEISFNFLQNISDIFKYADLGRTLNGTQVYSCHILFEEEKELSVFFKKENQDLSFQTLPLPENIKLPFHLKAMFIPANESLSWFKGFLAAYEERENGFNATYSDLARKLSLLPLRNNQKTNEDLLKEIEDDTQIIVTQLNGEFFVKQKGDRALFPASSTSTGINKLATLIYLIRNGSLTKNSILIWDEPNESLNPRYIKLIAQFLQTLAKNGVQIFVATHDYLLAHSLSTAAEYRAQTDAPPMRFFSFYKGVDGTEVEIGATLAEIQNNSILDEYSAYFDLEQKLYDQKRLQSV